jgi:hypothetical protein
MTNLPEPRAHDPYDPRRDAPWAPPGTPEADPRLMGEAPRPSWLKEKTDA